MNHLVYIRHATCAGKGCDDCNGGEVVCQLVREVKASRPPCHPTAAWDRKAGCFGLWTCTNCGTVYDAGRVIA